MDDEGWIARPSSSEIKEEFRTTFLESTLSIDELRKRTISISGIGISDVEDGGVILRSVYWRIFLNTLPLSSISSSSLSNHLSSSRSQYDTKRKQYLRAPDGRWAEDCSIVGVVDRKLSVGVEGGGGGGGGLDGEEDGWDPLSLGDQNPWKEWFLQQELRKVIMQDVERTFPDIPYFHSISTRRSLLTILFLWSIQHPDIGYRQGMHELLAVILLVVDRDSLSPSSQENKGVYSPLTNEAEMDPAELILARRFIEHDTFALFNTLMENAKKWYEWRSETDGGGGGGSGKSPRRQAKIIEICNSIQGMIKGVDPLLSGRMEIEGVEGQIWAIRYVRLLFTREMPLSMAMRLWDGIFAMDPTFERDMVESVCVALIMRIRNLLIPADYAMMLTSLLRYPPHSSSFPLSIPLILSQALFLRDNIAPSTGAAITLQNQEQLGISALAEEAEMTVETRRPMPRRAGLPQARQGGGLQSRPLEGLAKGLFERAQAAGIDKAILSTVSEFRKNLPEFTSPPTSAFSFRTFSSPSSDGFSTIPDLDAVVAKPPPRTLRDADREIAELRLVMIGMGKAMDKWLEGVQPSSETAEENATTMANWQGLRRLQQALLDGGSVPTADLARDWAWSADLESQRVTPSGSADNDPLADSVQSSASDPVLLTHPTSSEDSTRPSSANRQSPSSSQLKSPIHPPFTSSFTGMMNGTSPRQFAFPSPFATLAHDSAATSRRQATPIPLPPPISTSPRSDVASRLSAASQSASIDHYPPSTPKNVEPLSGSAIVATPIKKKDFDPLLGVGV